MKQQTSYRPAAAFLFSLLAFIEGGNVMLVEIGGSNLLASTFGNTIQLWSSVLGASLAGLAVGYHAGGKVSLRNPHKSLLVSVCAMIFLNIIIPYLTPVLSESLFSIGTPMGLIISSFIIIFPILFFCGMVSPLLIRIISGHSASAGHSAGSVFFISTIGGIVFTLLAGLYVIPVLGLRFSFVSMSILQCGSAVAILLLRKQWILAEKV